MCQYVTWLELFSYFMCCFSSKVILIFYAVIWGMTVGKELRNIIYCQSRESYYLCSINLNRMVGDSKVGRAVTGAAYIKERNMEKNWETTSRGEKLEEFIAETGLEVENVGKEPTYESKGNITRTDVTLTKNLKYDVMDGKVDRRYQIIIRYFSKLEESK